MKKSLITAIAILFFAGVNSLQACECSESGSGGNNEAALIDSLNRNFINDTAFLAVLKDSVAHAKKCFIGNVKSITVLNNPFIPETLTITCDRIIKGSNPGTFRAVNFAYGGNCIISGAKLVGKKFLCILSTDTIPGILMNLGVAVWDCGGGIGGIFVTQERIVTFGYSCAISGPTFCSYFTKNTSLQQFLNVTSVQSPAIIRNKDLPIGIAQSRFGVFTLNGRTLEMKSLPANRLSQSVIIKDGRKMVTRNAAEIR